MSDHSNSAQYRRVREEFEQMTLDERAFFLVEAAVATFIRGVDAAGRAVIDTLAGAFEDIEEQDAPPPAPEPAPPGSASKSSGRSAETSASSKRKTTTKKQTKRPSSGEGSSSEAS